MKLDLLACGQVRTHTMGNYRASHQEVSTKYITYMTCASVR